ncbi:MAG: NADH:flavin oxidoreductase [bacterium]
MKYRRIASLKTADEFKAYLKKLDFKLPFADKVDSGDESPLAKSAVLKSGFEIGNRFAILPMEGWDGTHDGRPTRETERRWRRFGASGAKLIWGGEAVAVRHDGRANPNQLLIDEKNLKGFEALRRALVSEHKSFHGCTDDLYVGLQLTHSGRFSKPNDKELPEPKTLYAHPVLDRKFNIDAKKAILSDDEIFQIIDAFVRAAKLAHQAGFHFVDLKHCHGYLGHEFLSAVDRPGQFGGALANRMRFLNEIAAGIRSEAPGLQIGVRLSMFDWIPFRAGGSGIGEPEERDEAGYRYAFGGNCDGVGIDLSEPTAFLENLAKLDVQLVCLTAGSPYYNPHIQRPALFPPSNGYQPPEDPLIGVARQINVTAELKKQFPNLLIVGSGYSYLQEFLPNVAHAVIGEGKADFVGLGRMALSYPELPADILAGKPLKRKKLCRTFSDCTTAPRSGLISGCYPLDAYYKKKPEARQLQKIKRQF